MPSILKKTILSAAMLSLSSFVNASLITNGSFEQLNFDDGSESVGMVSQTNLKAFENKNSKWDVFYSLPGWETVSGAGIELQKNVVSQSQNGSHHVELDSHPKSNSNSVMAQSINSLSIGADYLLEFYYKPRTNKINDNGINVFWYDADLDFDISMEAAFVVDGTRNTTPDWALQTVSFTALEETMSLGFGAFGKQNKLGGLIDNVSLKQVSSVPEPSMFILFTMAVTWMFMSRRKKVK